MDKLRTNEATWSRTLPLTTSPRAIARVSLTYRKHTHREGYYAAIALGQRLADGGERFALDATSSRLIEQAPWRALHFISLCKAMSEPARLRRVQERLEGGEVSVAMSVLCGVGHEASHAIQAAVEL